MTFKTFALVAAFSAFGTGLAHANETAGEKVKNGVKEGWKDTKQEYRSKKADMACDKEDKTSAEYKKCIKAKVESKAKNAKDEAGQAVDETKDKID